MPVLEALKSDSGVSEFKLRGELARALIRCTLVHRSTGLDLTGTYTQIVTFRDSKILHLHEIHDVSRMRAFWNLVLSEEEEPRVNLVKGNAAPTSWRQQLPTGWPGAKRNQ